MNPVNSGTRQFCPSGQRIRARLARKWALRAAESDAAVPETPEERVSRFKEQFSGTRQLDGLTSAAAGLPAPIFYAVSAAAAAGAALGGYAVATKAPLEGTAAKVVHAGTAAAAGGAVAAGASSVNKKRAAAAGVQLWNSIAAADDPTVVDPEVADGIKQRFAGSQDAVAGIRQSYAGYLQVLIPPGMVPLLGDETQKCRAFLDAVGLPDEEAALVHLDVGRTFFRQRLEVSDVDEAAAGARTFQKLIYVSSQLFGEVRSGFLTPWVARFGVSPEQVAIAKRESGSALLTSRLRRDFGGVVPTDAEGLRAVRVAQRELGITDAAAVKQLQALRGAALEAALEEAVAAVKTRGASADPDVAVRALEGLLAQRRAVAAVYADALAAAEAEAGSPEEVDEAMAVVPGLPELSVEGTRFAAPSAKNDLLDAYKLFMRSKVDAAGTALPPELDADLAELRTMLALPERKADDTRAALVADAYQTILAEAVRGGRLDDAESPAAVLNELITRVAMPGEQALAMHLSMYRQKLRECLEDSKIDDEDARALARTARLLCLKAEQVAEVDGELKGEVLRATIRRAMDAGVEKFSDELAEEVEAAKRELRMADSEAFEALEAIARSELVRMVNSARNKGNKLDNARELRQVVYYSNVVLAPLVAATKGKSEEDRKEGAMKELAETMAKAREEADKEKAASTSVDDADAVVSVDNAVEDDLQSEEEAKAETTESAAAAEEVPEDTPASLAKAEKAKKEREEGTDTVTTASGKEIKMSAQKDITVRDDFALDERVEIYKTYLMFCMTGDVVQLPMGGTIVVERDEQEFARLSQLGDVLGLSPMDVYSVHSEMAEDAYKAQAEAIAPGGNLSPEGAAELKEMAEKMGIGEERAEKIVRGVTNKRLVGNLQSLKAQGELTLEKVLELQEQDIDVSTVLADNMRGQLYDSHVADVLSRGDGAAVDADALLRTLPADLKLDVDKTAARAVDVARGKARSVMVQAFAYYRTRDYDSAIKYVNNLLACAAVAEAGGKALADDVKWDAKEEILDLYGLFCDREADAEARSRAAGVLQLADTEAAGIAEAVDNGSFQQGLAGRAAAKTTEGSTSIF